MAVQVVLPDRSIPLEPGGDARHEIRVRNIGPVADRFTFEVVGAAASWTTVDPPVLTLGPDESGCLQVHFHPPRAAHVRAGSIPFGLVTTSARDGAGSVTEQLLELSRFADTTLELAQRSVRRRAGTFRLVVGNRGNSTLCVRLRGRAPDAAVHVDCLPRLLTVFPGEVGHCRVRVRARYRWRGPVVAVPFQVVVDPGAGSPPLIAAGELIHHPVLAMTSRVR